MYKPKHYKSNSYKAGCLVLLLPLLLLGCVPHFPELQNETQTDGEAIYVWHDDDREVTCWVYAQGYKGGISCIPDDQLQ